MPAVEPQLHPSLYNGCGQFAYEVDSSKTIDLALLSQNMLRGEDLTNFIKRSVEMIK